MAFIPGTLVCCLSVSPIVMLGCVIVFSLVWASRNRKSASTAPGPFPWPLIGNLASLGKKPHEYLTQLRAKYGDVFQITMGSTPTIVLNGLKTIRSAMIKQAEDFAGRPDFYSFKFIANGNSMGFGDFGPRWKMHRRIAQNSLALFTNKRNNPIEMAIASEADVLTSNLIASDGAPFNPHNEIYLSVGNIICALCFGKRYQRDDEDFTHLIKMNDEFMAFAGAGNPVDIMPWMRHFTKGSFKKFIGILDTMNKFSLKKRQEHLDTYDASQMRDITDALIKATHDIPEEEKEAVGLTNEHILTTVQELIGAGFDTIASSLQWSVLFMATHPDVQEAAHAEIREKVGLRQISFDDIENLPYIEACLFETMRHSCIFPFALPHSTTRDTVLDGHFIRANTLVFVNLWSVNRDPEVFNNPNKFDPSRFLDSQGNVDKTMTDMFLPFGAGRRKCPGEQLARMELFMFFASMIQKCLFKTIPGKKPVIDSKYGLTLKPLDFQVAVSVRQ
ncbi:cytochrome P450 1A1-like [Ylistrum balloti]|uniref:cytochrome P450 1A1-like n=1 Tax=Ylistrum balloti TaxID=509963 RepID=UPI002905E1DD|nr:cytochrome P450 1A1-like [Ylistrum balloti]